MNTPIHFKKLSLNSFSLVALSLFCTTSQANLLSIGNGLIYDSDTDVTWIADGTAFSQSIANSTINPSGNPYNGPLLGTVVQTPFSGSHTIAADDVSYQSGLNRWVGSWWAASAWAESFTYQFDGRTVSDWRLPTTAEANQLMNQVGAGNYGATPPFVWLPPFYWTANVTSATNADVARPLAGSIDSFTLMNGALPRYSNVWAVVSGNVAAVPVPAAAWLFGSVLAGFVTLGRRKHPIGL